ncbi:MAG TPA: CDP-archaeol synthase [Ktedonobacteraceae bacterium]|nr:CDP-archaeol synthase [Ktedonobacteraceae bacterium]
MQVNSNNKQTGSLKPERKGVSSLLLRWLSALVLIPLVLMFVWFGGWAAFAATLLVVVLSAIEVHRMLLNAGYHPLIWISFGLGGLFLLSVMWPGQRLFLLESGLGVALLGSFFWLLFRRQLDGAVVDWALTLAVPIYLGWPMSFFLLLRGYDPGRLQLQSAPWIVLPAGAWWLLATLLGVWAFDGAAFFAGRHFGRHKLAPAISPAKTWEGAAGGLLLCCISCLVVTVLPLGLPWYLAIVLAVCISFAATVGDLAESLIKRQMHVKDSGQIVPGHGGMLDRIDSLLFAVVIVYLFAHIV